MTAVTDATFADEVLNAEGTVLIEFWAEWCGPCRAVAPVLDAIGEEHPSMTILKMNADDNPQTAAKYLVTSIPAMKVFHQGELVKTIIGAKPKPALEADLAAFL